MGRSEKRKLWERMRRYRLWEANRKVFLYPENYLEPELRDDKTASFKGVESKVRDAKYPNPPHGARHLYAVARFDGTFEGADPTTSFVLTRGYWEEAEAQAQAEKLNLSVAGTDARYFVLPVRVSHESGVDSPS